MKTKDVLVIGAGIAGCAVALALAKRGISVTILTTSSEQRMYYSHFFNVNTLEEKLHEIKASFDPKRCSRATEHLVNGAKKSVDELLEPKLLLDRNGNIELHRCLLEQLHQCSNVEWLDKQTVFELLTLDDHSTKPVDIYKKPTCLGVLTYHHVTGQIDKILAKETILATGGATSLFPFSTHSPSAQGQSLAMAQRAGARLINMDHFQFYPLNLYDKEKPCIPLPLELLHEGGKLYLNKNESVDINLSDSTLAEFLYQKLQSNHSSNLWLDLTLLDTITIKEKYPVVDTICLNYGYNISKDLIPVSPAAQYTNGGIAVDKVGQTTVQRLRAIGEAACTGLSFDYTDITMGVIESLTWAVSCAEEIAKQIPKFIYYYPEIRNYRPLIDQAIPLLHEDWWILSQIMWSYVGIVRNVSHLSRAYDLLQRLKYHNESEEMGFSIERKKLCLSLETAIMITKAALDREKQSGFRLEAGNESNLLCTS